jgi:PAS domain S-box-containing protein
MMKLMCAIIHDDREHLRILGNDLLPCFRRMELFLLSDTKQLFLTAENSPVHIIIIDGLMKEPKVLQIIASIKNDNRFAGSKVVMTYSEKSNHDLREKALSAGADCFLKYPIDEFELKSQLKIITALIEAETGLLSREASPEATSSSESDNRLRAYLDYSPYGVFVVNRFGEYTEVNPAACKITGYTKQELLKLQVSDLLSDESKEAGLQHFREVAEKGYAYTEVQIIKNNRDKIWCSVAAVKITDDEMLGFKMDITDHKKNILAIEESEMKLRLAMKVAKMGYWRYELETNKVEWSPGHDVLFGIPMEQFQGNLMAVQACVHPDDRAHGEANLANAIKEKKPFENYYRVVHPNGQIRWLFSYGILLQGTDGNTNQIFGITRDITENKVAEQELKEKNRNSAFLNSMAIKLANLPPGEDATQFILENIKQHCNAMVAIFTRYNPTKKTFSIKHVLTENRLLQPVLSITGENFLKNEMELSDDYYNEIRKNNVGIYSNFSELTFGKIPSPIGKAINKITGIETIFGISHLVSETVYGGTILAFRKGSKLPEKEFLETYAYMVAVSLRRRLAEKELIEAKSKIEKSDLLKTAFINNINHEIRTPVNSILGFGEILAQDNIDPNEKTTYYNTFHQSTKRLLQTITDYMDISIIVSGNLSPVIAPFSLKEVIDELQAAAELQNEKKKLQLFFGFPAEISNLLIDTDREMLRKALLHLMNNAIKFTPEGSVSAGCSITNNSLEFYFIDTGIGITREKLQAIFTPFEKENHAYNSGYEGSGLGLAICRGIATALEGKLHIQSKKNKGTNAFFTIPLNGKIDTVDVTKSEEVSAPVRTQPLILVAEDIEANYLFAEIILQRAGARVIRAENGAEAIELCRKHPDISMILMDIKMPVIDGIEATREILKFRNQMPVIAVTAYAKTGKEHLIRAAGCIDILPKPFRKKELLMKISKYIKL